MHNLHTEDNSCATPQHKLLHGKHNINTQYKSKRENTYFSKKKTKKEEARIMIPITACTKRR